jgi:hypothetical protein
VDECLSREGRFLRDEEQASIFSTRDVSPASGANVRLRVRGSPIRRMGTSIEGWLAGV